MPVVNHNEKRMRLLDAGQWLGELGVGANKSSQRQS